MAPTTTFRDMYNALVVVLKTVMDPNNTASPLFQNADDSSWNIYDGPQTEFAGTPAAIIIPKAGPASTFISNYENVRGYGFYVFVAMDTEVASYATSRINMRLIVDAVLDALDRSDMLNNTVDILSAVSTQWVEEESTTGMSIVAPLEIIAKKTVQAQLS